LIIYCIFGEYCFGFSIHICQGECVSFVINVKGGEGKILLQNCQNAKSCHQCQRGRLLVSSLFGVLSVLSLMSIENGEKERRNRETKV
jgi:hypothetical protein